MALQLDTTVRGRVVEELKAALGGAAVGSRVALRGSLAAGTADAYSDIDTLWEVGADEFVAVCEGIGDTLSRVRPLASLRFDRDWVGSPTRRLVFARFDGLPLFWRLDLEILSATHDPAAPPPPADETHWSHTHSALMCAVAAIKAFLRNRPETGAELVSKGFERIHIPVPNLSPLAQVLALVDTIYDADDTHAVLADEVRRLYGDAFGGGP